MTSSLKHSATGTTVDKVCRKIVISEVTFYKLEERLGRVVRFLNPWNQVLYQLWIRSASGSYFIKAIRIVSITKSMAIKVFCSEIDLQFSKI